MDDSKPVGYLFSRSYQTKLLALLCIDTRFVQSFREILKPEYFHADPVYVDVCRTALDYFDKHRKCPTLDALQEAIMDLLANDVRRAKDEDGYALALGAIADENKCGEKEDVIERAVRFARQQAMAKAIYSSIDLLEQGEFDKVEKLITDAKRVGQNKTDLGMDWFKDHSWIYNQRSTKTCPTGLASLDDCLFGGLACGELGIVESPPNRGKSICLINFGAEALKRGYDVVHCTHEMAAEDVGARYGALLLRAVVRKTPPEEMLRKLEEYRKRILRNLTIKFWPQNVASVEDIESYLWTLISVGVIDPENRKTLLLVDYGQVLKPTRFYSEKRHETRETYQGLIRLTHTFGVPLWSAMQSNRESVSKRTITIADLSECFAVAADAPVIISLNQDKDEKEQEKARIFVARSRNTLAHNTIDVDIDYEHMMLTDMGRSGG